MEHLFFIALGGSFGAMLRYLISKYIQSISDIIFPFGTLFVNAGGSFLIGFFTCLFDYTLISRDTRSFISIGFLGAFTTFSTYSLETFSLFRDNEIKLGIINLLLNNILCLVMVFTGIITSRLILRAIR